MLDKREKLRKLLNSKKLKHTKETHVLDINVLLNSIALTFA